MVTSKSNEAVGYLAGASIFSGRPDPTWPVEESVAGDLVALWNRMEPYAGPVPSPPGLGYRGCFLRDSTGREWRAYRGLVTMTGERTERRRDGRRQFELLLLRSAPDGLIPNQLVDGEFTN